MQLFGRDRGWYLSGSFNSGLRPEVAITDSVQVDTITSRSVKIGSRYVPTHQMATVTHPEICREKSAVFFSKIHV